MLSAGALATAMAERSASASSASVPAAWIDGTVKAAAAMVVGQPVAAGAVSAAAISFSETMVRSLFMTRLKIAAAAVLAVGGAVFVAAIAAEQGNGAMRKAEGLLEAMSRPRRLSRSRTLPGPTRRRGPCRSRGA